MGERGGVGFIGGGMGLYGDASKGNTGMNGLVGGVARFDSPSVHLIQVESVLFNGTN